MLKKDIISKFFSNITKSMKAKIPINDKISTIRQIAVMTDAGIAINDTLEDVAENTENKALKEIYSKMQNDINAGMSMYDTMNYIKPDVCTICVGQAASMGAFLLSAGEKGKRFALPNARIMIHQPLGGARGQATDIQIQAEEILRLKKTLNQLLADHTGQDVEQIEKDTDRDNFMSAQEACDYGLVDKVISKHE